MHTYRTAARNMDAILLFVRHAIHYSVKRLPKLPRSPCNFVECLDLQLGGIDVAFWLDESRMVLTSP